MTSEGYVEKTENEHEASARREELERKSMEEVRTAIIESQYDTIVAWEAVTVPQLRGTPDVFEPAKRSCRSEDHTARARGLAVLA